MTQPTATVGTAPAAVTTTNPSDVPVEIDVPYLNRILASLDAATGEVVRLVVATKALPREGYERLQALYATDELFDLSLGSLSREISRGVPGYRDPPGDASTVVVDLITGRPTCAFARVSRDYSAVSTVAPPSPAELWVAITPTDPARDQLRLNPVGWAYLYEGTSSSFGPPSEDPCTGR